MNQESGIRNQESGIRNQESGIRNQESLASLASISHASTSRSAFTMIELVFIIVILGILGAIAVPKMAASREDAQFVALKQDIATLMQATPAMAMSQGADKIKKISDVITLSGDIWAVTHKDGLQHYLNNSAETLEGAAHIKSKYSPSGAHCVTVRLVDIDQNGKADGLEVWVRPDGGKCQKLGNYGDRGFTVPLAGTSVKF